MKKQMTDTMIRLEKMYPKCHVQIAFILHTNNGSRFEITILNLMDGYSVREDGKTLDEAISKLIASIPKGKRAVEHYDVIYNGNKVKVRILDDDEQIQEGDLRTHVIFTEEIDLYRNSKVTFESLFIYKSEYIGSIVGDLHSTERLLYSFYLRPI